VEQDILVFKGIRYAKAPIGNLRWRPPEELEPDTLTRAADQRGPACFQDPTLCVLFGGGNPTPPDLSEDCLNLNIWTPQLEANLPVLVWIHGGGYVVGAGDLPPYMVASLARRQAVVVTINYRLGHLGFFAHPALDEEARREGRPIVNNFALLDQIAALKWVKNHIRHFGGNKDNVTLFGQSAGARSVLSLFVSPEARDQGLFHKGVAQSAYGLPDVPRENALQRGVDFASYFGIGEDGAAQDILVALRELPANEFWQIKRNPDDPGSPESKAAFGEPVPICGDSVLPEPLLDLFARRKQARLPLIIGNNSNDSSVLTLFLDNPNLISGLVLFAGLFKPEYKEIPRLYEELAEDPDEFDRQVGRDLLFGAMTYAIANDHSAADAKSWRYYFDYVAERERTRFPQGARHADEVPYALDTLDIAPPPGLNPGDPPQEITEQDRNFAQTVSNYWLQFARRPPSDTSSDIIPVPGIGHLPAWPENTTDDAGRVMWLGRQLRDRFEVDHNFLPRKMELLSMLLRDLPEILKLLQASKPTHIHSYQGVPHHGGT